MNQQHWVAVTPDYYFDDAYYFKVIDYNLALDILQLLEAPESVFGGLESYIKNHVEAKSPEVNVIRGGGLSEDASAAKASGRKRKAAGSEKQTASGGEQIEQASSEKSPTRDVKKSSLKLFLTLTLMARDLKREKKKGLVLKRQMRKYLFVEH